MIMRQTIAYLPVWEFSSNRMGRRQRREIRHAKQMGITVEIRKNKELVKDEIESLPPRLLASDADAEERFFELLYPKLLGWAAGKFRVQRADRDDFALEVIEKALSRLEKFNPSRAKFLTWLFAIARNHAYDRARKIRDRRDPLMGALPEEVLYTIEESYSAPDSDTEEPIEQSDLINAMAPFSEEDRKLLQLVFGTDLNATEIGLELGISSASVRKRKERLLKRLQSVLQPQSR